MILVSRTSQTCFALGDLFVQGGASVGAIERLSEPYRLPTGAPSSHSWIMVRDVIVRALDAQLDDYGSRGFRADGWLGREWVSLRADLAQAESRVLSMRHTAHRA